jgi:fatty-acyl-CoA synthase
VTSDRPPLPSYVAGPSDQPLRGATIGAELRSTARRHPDRDAVVALAEGERRTWAELLEEAERAAAALVAHRVRPGDRVGIWSANRLEWVVAQFATALVGAVLVNVNPAYRTHELRHALRTSEVSVLLCARGFHHGDYLAMLEELRGALPDLRHVVVFDDGPLPQDAVGWETFVEAGRAVSTAELEAIAEDLDPDDPINIQFTSGTTGLPKGATLTHHNVVNDGFFVGERLGYGQLDRICVPVPFYHCFGMVLGTIAALTHGAAIVIPGGSFDAGETLAAVETERCTSLYGVPTMFIAELEHPDLDRRDLTSLRTGVMAGSPCPVEVMRRVIERMHCPEITICYGMTETSPVSFQTRLDDDLEVRVATVGSVHPWVEAKVVDPADGRTLPRGSQGELCVRGYLVMRGYWEDREATSEAIDPAGWMHSGDLAVMLDDGRVHISGRLKDLIIRGGENIAPREIEEFLFTHPGVADVQVIGVPDPIYGEAVCAWVVPHQGARLTEDEIREWCRGKIATFKIPRYVLIVESFPMTVTGKVQKFRMREQAIAELGLDEAAAIPTA